MPRQGCVYDPTDAELGILQIDYTKLYTCATRVEVGFFFPVLLGWGCFLTYLLGHTADAYFSPTLAAISVKLKLTYDVAGVTFLALGNGAPDVFSSIAAFSSKDPSVVLIGVCELLGASVFVTTIVVGAVAWLHPTNLQPKPFIRDIIFQVLANTLLVISAIYGTVTVGISLGYIAFYILYVVVVLILDRLHKGRVGANGGQGDDEAVFAMSAFWFTPSDIVEFSPRQEQTENVMHDFLLLEDDLDNEREREEPGSPERVGEVNSGEASLQPNRPSFRHTIIAEYFSNPAEDVIDGSALLLRSQQESSSTTTTNNVMTKKYSPFNTSKGDPESVDFSFTDDEGGAAGVGGEVVGPDPAEITGTGSGRRGRRRRGSGSGLKRSFWNNMYWQQWRLRRKLLREIRASEWSEKSLIGKVLSLLEAPLIFMRNLTIPTVEEDSWSRLTAIFYPLFSPLLLLFIAGGLDAKVGSCPLWVVVELGGACISVGIFLTTHESRPPTSFAASTTLIVMAFIMCSAWIYTIASELVAVIEALGKIWGIPSSLLGLTLLAWGNSVGDLITNIAVARSGLSDMAIAGCFAGPTFNLLVGMGLSFLWKCITTSEHSFQLQLDIRAKVSLAFLYVALAVNLVIAYFSKFKLGKAVAISLIIIYTLCTILQIILVVTKGSL